VGGRGGSLANRFGKADMDLAYHLILGNILREPLSVNEMQGMPLAE
jgi:hypothetical protein